MSSPSQNKLRLSRRARQDLIDILRYTAETWGPNQLHAYRAKLDEALAAIERNPQLGHTSATMPANHRLYLVGAHVIVYRIQATNIGVMRVLHQRMRLSQHL